LSLPDWWFDVITKEKKKGRFFCNGYVPNGIRRDLPVRFCADSCSWSNPKEVQGKKKPHVSDGERKSAR